MSETTAASEFDDVVMSKLNDNFQMQHIESEIVDTYHVRIIPHNLKHHDDDLERITIKDFFLRSGIQIDFDVELFKNALKILNHNLYELERSKLPFGLHNKHCHFLSRFKRSPMYKGNENLTVTLCWVMARAYVGGYRHKPNDGDAEAIKRIEAALTYYIYMKSVIEDAKVSHLSDFRLENINTRTINMCEEMACPDFVWGPPPPLTSTPFFN